MQRDFYYLYLFTNVYFHSGNKIITGSKLILNSVVAALRFCLPKHLQRSKPSD